MNTQGDATPRIIRSISRQSPDCSPSSPAPLPAREMSVQGNPPVMRSTAPARSRTDSAVTSRTSSHRGTPGQCCARTAEHHGSFSTCPAIPHPARSRPRSWRPMPEKRERSRISDSTAAQRRSGRAAGPQVASSAPRSPRVAPPDLQPPTASRCGHLRQGRDSWPAAIARPEAGRRRDRTRCGSKLHHHDHHLGVAPLLEVELRHALVVAGADERVMLRALL